MPSLIECLGPLGPSGVSMSMPLSISLKDCIKTLAPPFDVLPRIAPMLNLL